MATSRRKRQQNRKSLLIVTIIVIVGLVVTGAVLLVSKYANRGVADPNELTVQWKQGDRTESVKPYRVCDLFEKDKCETFDENTAHIQLGGEETGELIVGSEIGSNTWTLQRFYSDDAVNSSTQKNPGEADRETVAGSAAVANDRASLGVIEVSTAVVGKNAAGEETTYGITWSLANDNAAKQ